MGRKKPSGVPFSKGCDLRVNKTGRPSVLEKDESAPYKRVTKELFQCALANKSKSLHELPGLRLRPCATPSPQDNETIDGVASNDIIDLSKLNQAHIVASNVPL